MSDLTENNIVLGAIFMFFLYVFYNLYNKRQEENDKKTNAGLFLTLIILILCAVQMLKSKPKFTQF
jgi:NADH:ubiquinone oxidoreductase subunit 6 (subunit J)